MCEIDDTIVGFSLLVGTENNVWAFLYREYEGKGIGKKLHQLCLTNILAKPKKTIYFQTETNSRAELFTKTGWDKT